MAKEKQYIKYQAIVVLETELDDDSLLQWRRKVGLMMKSLVMQKNMVKEG